MSSLIKKDEREDDDDGERFRSLDFFFSFPKRFIYKQRRQRWRWRLWPTGRRRRVSFVSLSRLLLSLSCTRKKK